MEAGQITGVAVADGYITDPRQPDTDGDGLADGEEAAVGTDPTQANPDDNGLDDVEEITTGTDGHVTNLHAADSDDDAVPDGRELVAGRNRDQAEGEDLGTTYVHLIYGNEGAVHDGTGHVLPWRFPALPTGTYHAAFRAHSLGALGGHATLAIDAAGESTSHEFLLRDRVYRWHASSAFRLARTGTVAITPDNDLYLADRRRGKQHGDQHQKEGSGSRHRS